MFKLNGNFNNNQKPRLDNNKQQQQASARNDTPILASTFTNKRIPIYKKSDNPHHMIDNMNYVFSDETNRFAFKTDQTSHDLNVQTNQQNAYFNHYYPYKQRVYNNKYNSSNTSSRIPHYKKESKQVSDLFKIVKISNNSSSAPAKKELKQQVVDIEEEEHVEEEEEQEEEENFEEIDELEEKQRILDEETTSKSDSERGSEHSDSTLNLTTTSKQTKPKRRNEAKKGRRHKVKLLSSSPCDVSISIPSESSSSTSSLKNDSVSTPSMRSSSDSLANEDSYKFMNDIELEFKRLLLQRKKSSSNEIGFSEDITLQIVESPRYEHYVFGQEDSTSQNKEILDTTDNNEVKSDELTTNKTGKNKERRFNSLKKIKSLPTLNEINDDKEEATSQYEEQKVIEKQDYESEPNSKTRLSPNEEISASEQLQQQQQQKLKEDNQLNLLMKFYADYSRKNQMSTRLIKATMGECLKKRQDYKATEDDINRALYVLDSNRDAQLDYNEFFVLIHLFFSRSDTLRARIVSVLNHMEFKHETRGYLSLSQANEFVDFLNRFYGKKFNFIIFHERISYDKLAHQLSDDLASFTFF